MGIYVSMLKPHCGPTHLPQRNNDSLTRASELFSSSELGLISGLILAHENLSTEVIFFIYRGWTEKCADYPLSNFLPNIVYLLSPFHFLRQFGHFRFQLHTDKVAFFFYLSRHVKQ